MLKIPATLDEVTPEWLTAALELGGRAGAPRVSSCHVEPIGQGKGIASQMARLTPAYESSAPGEAPESLIVKLPPLGESDRVTARRLNLFEIENRFYAELALQAGVRVPLCFYNDMNRPADEHVLLLEDITGSVAGDDVAGCSPERASAVVLQLAALHAAWWDSQKLHEFTWMKSWDDPAEAALIQELYVNSWGEVEKFGFEIPDPVREIGRRLRPHSAVLHRELSARPCTIVHGDVRLDNLLFGETAEAPPITIIDWQIVGRLRGPYDIATFLVSSLEPDVRRATEISLLEAYHAALCQSGVAGYDFKMGFDDYRRAMLSWFSRVIFVGASYDLGNERGHALIQGLLDRVAAALVDLDCDELLP